MICVTSPCLPAEGDGGEDGGGGSVEKHLGGRGGRLQEVLGHCRHITVTSFYCSV